MSQRKPDPTHPRCSANGKLRYRTQQAAERTLAVVIVHGSARQVPRRAYHCDECGGWHLTKQEKRT